MDSVIGFFLVFAVISGVIGGIMGSVSHKVKPSRNIFTFFFFDRY
jgi:hypothetical protein